MIESNHNGPGAVPGLFRPVAALLLSFWVISDSVAQPGPLDLSGECTIAVISGDVTSDGRPIIWKNRDIFDHDQRFIYYAPYQRDSITTFAFIGDCFRNDTTRIFMGANEHGFAIMNSDSYNLSDSLFAGLDDGTIMRLALETCVALSDFEQFLDSTNIPGRRDCWNFGCLDSSGASAIYECANHSYVRFDPLDVENPFPGIVARANYSFSGEGYPSGYERYKRATELMERRLSREPIDAEFVLGQICRDLGNVFDVPYPLPYHRSQLEGPLGYIYNFGCTIENRSTSSAVVIRGIAPGEDPGLTTIFAFLGPPVLSVAYPLWVKSGAVPIYLSHPGGAPMYQYCRDRSARLYDNPEFIFHLNSRCLLDDDSAGIYSYTYPLERWGLQEADRLLDSWRAQPPSADDVQFEQFRIARAIFTGFQLETAEFINDTPDQAPAPNMTSLFNYPNPFNDVTHIVYRAPDQGSPPRLRIFDLLGRLVIEMSGTENGSIDVYWTGRDSFGSRVSSGVYFYSINSGSHELTNKMLLLK